MAIVLTANGLFEALTEVGVRQAIVQDIKGDSPEFLNIAFWFNAGRGLILFITAIIIAPWIAIFYDEPSLIPLLRVAFSTMILNGLTSPKVFALHKKFKFSQSVWITQGSGLVATIFTLILSLYIRDVWALVFGTVFEAFARLILSFLLCPILPNFRFDKDSSRALFGFTKGMAGLPILAFFVMQADVFVLGKLVSKEILGKYSLALNLANFPVMIFSRVVQPMIVPVFSSIKDNKAKLQNTFTMFLRAIWIFGLPMATFLGFFSSPILTIVYGAKYASMAPAYSVLSFYIIVYISSMVSFSVYIAIARPTIHRSFTILRAVLIALFMYPAALFFGPVGAAAALLFCLAIATVLQSFNLKNVIGLTPLRFFGTLQKGLVLAIAIAIPNTVINLIVQSSAFRVLLGSILLFIAWISGFVLMSKDIKELKRMKQPILDTSEDQIN
jgi:O-antigen/teichoic acid export membrane protein